MLAFMDETACQSVTNVRRVFYAPNTKNIQVKCGERFKSMYLDLWESIAAHTWKQIEEVIQLILLKHYATSE